METLSATELESKSVPLVRAAQKTRLINIDADAGGDATDVDGVKSANKKLLDWKRKIKRFGINGRIYWYETRDGGHNWTKIPEKTALWLIDKYGGVALPLLPVLPVKQKVKRCEAATGNQGVEAAVEAAEAESKAAAVEAESKTGATS